MLGVPRKALLPMLVTEAGMIIPVIPDDWKAESQIFVGALPLANVTVLNAVQP